MKCLIIALISMFSLAHASQLDHPVRLNFYPGKQNFISSSYTYGVNDTDSDLSANKKGEVDDFGHSLQVSYAHKIIPKAFLGVSAAYQVANESGIAYGIPESRKFTSQGFTSPEVFVLSRLQTQKNSHGSIDLYTSFSPKIGVSEVGKTNSNRIEGRNIYKIFLSHGMLEDEWEFRTSLDTTYFDKGEEQNDFTRRVSDMRPYMKNTFTFRAQYKFKKRIYFNAGVGITYVGSNKLVSRGNMGNREIQGGSGSLFEGGSSYEVSKSGSFKIVYQLLRNDYFVKGDTENFDGRNTTQTFQLMFTEAF